MRLDIYTVKNLITGNITREEAGSHGEALYLVSGHDQSAAWEGPEDHADWSVTHGNDVKFYIISAAA